MGCPKGAWGGTLRMLGSTFGCPRGCRNTGGPGFTLGSRPRVTFHQPLAVAIDRVVAGAVGDEAGGTP